MENIKEGLVEQEPIKDQPVHKRDDKAQQPKAKPCEKVSKGGKRFDIC